MASQATKQINPHFSVLALVAFTVAFLVARTFTTLSPSTVIVLEGAIHIHHFWFGLILLAVGGWMGIVNQNMNIDQLAAVLYGAGGGLIADEVGLLLTLGDYWTELTYTLVIVFFALACMSILLAKYWRIIRTQLWGISRSGAILYLGIFLAAISVGFLLTTSSLIVFDVSIVLLLAACVVVLIYLIQRLRLTGRENKRKQVPVKR
ncbi:MAG: hypothetical protein WED04_12935 [Promethearchaeati archaeon SRVP18_Atabeyarchaeia-1]